MQPFTTDWYKQQCSALRIYPEKTRGQNFLLGASIPQQMIEQAQLTKNDHVIEIGPGLGILTHALTKTDATIHVYEIEKKMFTTPIMHELLESQCITATAGNILDADETTFKSGYSIISNVPYSISSQVITKFLTSAHPPKQMILMLQKEVVEKLVAQPPHISRLAVLTQSTSTPKKICNVPRNAFWPQPSVSSAVVALSNITQPTHLKTLELLTRVGFSHPRKKLANNLVAIIQDPKSFLHKAGINPSARPQEVMVQQWLVCAKILVEQKFHN